MMERIKNYIKNYFESSSKIKIFSDLLFYLIIIFFIIPSGRTLLIRASLFGPKIVASEKQKIIDKEEFNIDLYDLKGNKLNLQEFSNELVFLNFWATWCPPCRAEMPSIQRLYNEYKGKLRIILITNEESSKVDNYLKENGFDLPVYFQKTVATGYLNVHSLPTSFLISGKHEILVEKKGAANWYSKKFRQKLDDILGTGLN